MLLAIHARRRSETPPWNRGVVVNAADSEGGDGELREEEELPVDDK